MAAVQEARYSRLAVLLHWAIALMIGANLSLGWFLETVSPPVKMVLMPLHISCGISVLALTVVRVGWRVLHAPPPLIGDNKLEHSLAHLAHFMLYLGMVWLPLTGWAILSAHPAPGSAGFAAQQAQVIKHMPAPLAEHGAPKMPPPKPGLTAWGFIPVPAIAVVQRIGDAPEGLAAQKVLHDEFADWHSIGAYLMIALLLLHIAGVVKHQILDRQASITRMWF